MISKFFKRKKNSYYITFLTIIKKNQINLTVLRFFFQIRASSTVHSIQCFMDDEKQPTRKQQYAVRSVTIQPFDIQFSPNAVECLPTCTGMLHCCIGHLVPILEKPTSPHTPIHMHRHPEHTLAFCSTLFPCAASNQFSFQNKIQAYLLLFIELQNRRKDTVKIFRLKKSVARICEVGEYFSIVNFNEVYK